MSKPASSTESQRLEALVAASQEALLWVTSDGFARVENEAAAQLFGQPGAGAICPVASLLQGGAWLQPDGASLPPDADPLQAALLGRSLGPKTLVLRRPTRPDQVVRLAVTPILPMPGQAPASVVTVQDWGDVSCGTDLIQDLKEAIASLRELDALKTDFLNTISHELRTPLTNIMGYVELLQDEVVGPLNASQQDSVETVMKSARHLLTLINDMLDFMQLEAGKVTFAFSPLDMASLAAQVLSSIEARSGKPIASTLTALPGVPRARGDHQRVSQVLEHLLENAFKFTDEDGRIDVTIEQDDADYVRVTIKDTGIGIPADARHNLFSKFYQVETGLRRKQGGTGLGLAICKMLVERQGGRIGLESEVGRGTRVWFTLPPWLGS